MGSEASKQTKNVVDREANNEIIFLDYNHPNLWQYGLWSFQTGGTKLERFLPKNRHTQRKLLNFIELG